MLGIVTQRLPFVFTFTCGWKNNSFIFYENKETQPFFEITAILAKRMVLKKASLVSRAHFLLEKKRQTGRRGQ